MTDIDDLRSIDPSTIDVLHIHWPEKIFWTGGRTAKVILRAALYLLTIRRFKKYGVKIVWMVHNLKPHDMTKSMSLIWAYYSTALHNLVDGYMTLSPGTVPVVRQEFRLSATKPVGAIWHPAYDKISTEHDREEVRRNLGIPSDAKVFGLFGKIRPYKGPDDLITKFIADHTPDQYILVGGECSDPDYSARLNSLADKDPNVILVMRRMSDREFAAMQASVDAIVLPFVNTLHSGSMVHAVCEGAPVITPSQPFAESLKRELGDGWINTYSGSLEMGYLSQYAPPRSPANLAHLSADVAAASAIDFYRTITNSQK